MPQRSVTIHERLDEFGGTLGEVLKQTRATNGRVTRLEEETFGDPAHGTVGLIEIKDMVLDARAIMRAARWAIPVLATSNIAAVGALVYKVVK